MYSKNRNSSMCFVSVSIVLVLFFSMGFADYDADGVDLVGRNPYGYCPFAVASGDFVYSANGTVLEVLDIHTLEPVSEVVTESIVSGMAVSGNFVYIANWSDGFRVVDVSDPTNPSMVAELEFPGQCWDISVTGDFAYVGNDDQGLRIIDISNPLIPTLASTYLSTPGVKFEHAQVIDTLAYAATQSGLFILDVSDPAAPVQLGHSPAENGAWSVHVVDTIAYLPKVFEGIRMVNVADPTNPIELGYFQTPDAAYWVEVVDTIAYVAERFAGVQVLDISDLTAPDSIGMLSMDYADALYILGDSMYVASSSWGLKQVSIENLTAPVLLNEYAAGGYATDVYASDMVSYATLRGLGVGVFTRNEASEPEILSLIEMNNPARVNGSGDYLYVIEDPNLHIVDVNDPANPQIVSTWYEGASLTSYVVGDLLFIGGNPDLQILDISDASNPVLIGTLDGLPWVPFDLEIRGSLAYVVNRGGGFWIIDIGDPTAPQTIGGLEIFDYAWRLDISGQYAYVADRYAGDIRTIDISDPTQPFEVSSINIGILAQDVSCSGRYVYGLDAWEGIRIIDSGDPYNPVEVGYFNTGGYAQAVVASQGQLHVADGGGGFYLLETEFKAAVFTVNSTGDGMDAIPGDGICDDGTGDCTLRAAINEANATPGYNTIAFDIEGIGPHTIQPASALPTIIDPVEIDGSSEPDFYDMPIIEIDGTYAGETAGLVLAGHTSIQALVVNRFAGTGIELNETGNNVVKGCFVGLNTAGSQILGNGGDGICSNSKYNLIGGSKTSDRNVISGNGIASVRLHDHDVLKGSYIGTDISGSVGLGVGDGGSGVLCESYNLVGGFEPNAGNLIAGPVGESVFLEGTISHDNLIRGNIIGTDISGTIALGGGGIHIVSGAFNNHINDNLISGNDGNGISIVFVEGPSPTDNIIQGNRIGTNPEGNQAIPNEGVGILLSEAHNNLIGGSESDAGNVISGNTGYGLQLTDGSAYNEIKGNLIGCDLTGMIRVPNENSGVNIRDGAHDNLIGGLEPGSGNVISGNNRTGLSIGQGTGASLNYILGNRIGTNAAGTDSLVNTANGIFLFPGAFETMIGGLEPGEGNLISGNRLSGISIRAGCEQNSILGNYIGTDISGSMAIPNQAGGISSLGASHDIRGNLISGNNLDGILIEGESASGNHVFSNRIGSDASGTAAIPNTLNGIHILEASSNQIGGINDDDGNLISGNEYYGIHVEGAMSTENIMQGNLIGTDISGMEPLGNSVNGIGLRGGANNNLIGGAEETAGNVISANGGKGIALIGEGTNNNIIQDNFIGCDITGDNSDLGNGGGIVIAGGASNNLIGGMGEFTANWIGYNLGYGITIRDTSNTAGNSILGNGFTQNEIAGIDLSEINRGNDGPTANDSADVDTGPNNLQNYPERLNCGIESNNDFMLQYFIDSDPAHSAYPIHVEFFQADEESNQGYYLVVTDEYSDDDHTAGLKTLNLGNANELGQEGLWNGIRIVATATDANGNTSEFSEAIEIGNYVDIAAFEPLPEVFTLQQNYPNPFNPTTTIRYGLPEASDVSLTIYDLKGRVVKSYSERGRPAGWVNYEWSGTNMRGEPVSTGVYLCRLVAGEYTKTIKMVYLR
jgi:CSLREA domain-containing protein